MPVTGTEDVLDELYGVGVWRASAPAASEPEPEDPQLGRVLQAAERLGSVAAIAAASGLSTAEARVALARLEAGGYLIRRSLQGWERAAT